MIYRSHFPLTTTFFLFLFIHVSIILSYKNLDQKRKRKEDGPPKLIHFQKFYASTGICSKQGGRWASPAYWWNELRGIVDFLSRYWIDYAEFVRQYRHWEALVVHKNLKTGTITVRLNDLKLPSIIFKLSKTQTSQ